MRDDDTSCGERIRAERRRIEMTAVELAVMAGISAQYLNDIERGRRRCPLPTAIRLSNALGCELSVIDPMVLVPLSAVKWPWLTGLLSPKDSQTRGA